MGRASRKSRSPDPSSVLVVNPAAVRRRRSNLPPTCHGIVTEGEAIHSDGGAEVSSGHSSRQDGEGPNGRERPVVSGTR